MKGNKHEVYITLAIPLEASNNVEMKEWREDYIGVIPQTLQEKMTTMKYKMMIMSGR